MQVTIPKTSAVFAALLKADFTAQWRNRRSVIITLLVPVIILISWKGFVAHYGGAFVISSCITVGLVAIGLMGYSNAIARDRDKGIFQRLRVAPVPAWSIMASRLAVQLAMIVIMTLVVFAAGYNFDGIALSPAGYALTLLAAFIGGAVYLGLGQLIVGLIMNPESVNSMARLIYFVFIMVGMVGEFAFTDASARKVVHYSPYGTVKTMLASSLEPATWNSESTTALLLTLGYTIVFGVTGIRKFKWNKK